MKPKLLTTLPGYTSRQFAGDAVAGVTVAMVALPLSIAIAIASGAAPAAGLVTAVVGGFLISALGGSRVQIGGPTGAFIVVVYGVIAKHGFDGLLLATLMAGVILLAAGALRAGRLIALIPEAVIEGFTLGIAIVIATSQIKDLFGLGGGALPADFLAKLAALWGARATFNPAALAIGVATIVTIFAMRRWVPRIPGPVVAVALASAAVALFALPVDSVGSRYGALPAGLPWPHLPPVSPGAMLDLLPSALVIAFLAGVESLLSAVVADRMIGGAHRSNAELLAQGAANIAAPLFGGLPATGAIARTATNVRAGARTPVAGVVHAATLLLILWFAAPLARHIPLATLAALLMVVAYNMGEWAEIPDLLRLTRTDVAVWLVTLSLTVFADLTVAVGVGMVLAALLFIHRVAETTTVTAVTDEYVREGHVHILQNKAIPPYVKIFRIHGPFLFGATDKLRLIVDHVDALPAIVILRLRNMTAIDGTGLHAIEQLADVLHDSGRTLLLCGARQQPAHVMARSGFHRHVGAENMCAHVEDALARARAIHSTTHAEVK